MMSLMIEFGRVKASRTRLTDPTSDRPSFTTNTESMLSASGPSNRNWSSALGVVVASVNTGKSRGHQTAGSVVPVPEELFHLLRTPHLQQGFQLMGFRELLEDVGGHVRTGQIQHRGHVGVSDMPQQYGRLFGFEKPQQRRHRRRVHFGQERPLKFRGEPVQSVGLIGRVKKGEAVPSGLTVAAVQEFFYGGRRLLDLLLIGERPVLRLGLGGCSQGLFHKAIKAGVLPVEAVGYRNPLPIVPVFCYSGYGLVIVF